MALINIKQSNEVAYQVYEYECDDITTFNSFIASEEAAAAPIGSKILVIDADPPGASRPTDNKGIQIVSSRYYVKGTSEWILQKPEI